MAVTQDIKKAQELVLELLRYKIWQIKDDKRFEAALTSVEGI